MWGRELKSINLFFEGPNARIKTNSLKIIGKFCQYCKALQAEMNIWKKPYICLGSKLMLPFTHFWDEGAEETNQIFEYVV